MFPPSCLTLSICRVADVIQYHCVRFTTVVSATPKGKARPAAWRGRDNWVEGVNLGGNRAPARGRNRNSRPEPTPQAALAGFLGPDRMAGGSIGLRNCRGWGERASARRSAALSIAQSETGTLPGSQDFDKSQSSCFYSVHTAHLSGMRSVPTLIGPTKLVPHYDHLRYPNHQIIAFRSSE